MSSGGKSGGGSASKTYNYFGSAGGLLIKGPGDFLMRIVADNKIVWTGPLDLRSASVPATITIPGICTARIYRGTATQPVDPLLLSSGNHLGQDHPAYADCFWLMFDDALFGRERTTVQNWEAVVRRGPRQSIVVASGGFDPVALDADGQANPVVALLELLTDPLIGLGWPASRFDAPSWQALAEAAWARAADTYCSVFAGEQKAARAIAADLLVMLDAWIRYDPATGKLVAGRWPQPGEIDVNSLPLLTDDDLADIPEWDVGEWDDLKNDWAIEFTDRDKNFKKSSETRPNLYLQDFADGEIKPESVTRPYITRRAQAAAHLAAWDRFHSRPPAEGTLHVRRAKSTVHAPGTLLRADIDAEPGGDELRQVCRVLERKRPRTGSATLTLEADHSLAPQPWSPGSPGGEDPSDDDVPAIANVRLFEPPRSLADSEYALAVLASRPSSLVTDFAIYYDDSATGDFPRLGAARNFALRARLTSAYSDAATGAVAVELLDGVGREIVAADPGAAAARNNELLMIIVKIASGQVATDANNEAELEIYSVESMTSTGADTLDITALRGRIGTKQRSFAVDDEVWFIRRSALPIYLHTDFAGLVNSGGTGYLKLQPATAAYERPLADCANVPFVFASGRAFAPKITINSPAKDSGQDYTSVAVAGSLTFSIGVTDADANLTSVTILRRRSGGSDETISVRPISPTGGYSFSQDVSFATEGTYYVTIRGQDSTGRITDLVRRVECGTAGTGGGTQVATPQIHPLGNYYGSTISVTITCGTSGATIEYQLGVSSDSAPTGSWITYTGAFNVSPYTYGRRVWARATKAGLTDSYIASQDYYRDDYYGGGGTLP